MLTFNRTQLNISVLRYKFLTGHVRKEDECTLYGVNFARFSVANYRDKAIYLSGGWDKDWNTSAQVFALDLLKSEWRNEANLQQSRCNHSSCTLGEKIFVFGGFSGTDRILNSIEELDLSAWWHRWRLINITAMRPREKPAVCHVSDSEIAILGGSNFQSSVSDIFIFNTETGTAEKALDIDMPFVEESPSVNLGQGSIMSLVMSEDRILYLMKYERKENQLSIVVRYGRTWIN